MDLVPKILKDYLGEEDVVMSSLLHNYNLEDSEWLEIAKAIESNKEKLGEANKMILGLGLSGDQEAEFLGYDKQLLIYFFYDKHKPEKIEVVRKICSDYLGEEDVIMASLLHNFEQEESEWFEIIKDIEANPEKVEKAKRFLNKIPSQDDSAKAYDKKLLLYFFYDKHNPEKIALLPKIFQNFKGEEEVRRSGNSICNTELRGRVRSDDAFVQLLL